MKMPCKLLERTNTMVEKHGHVPRSCVQGRSVRALARPIDASRPSTCRRKSPEDRDLKEEFVSRKQQLTKLQQLADAIAVELKENPDDLVTQRDMALTLHRLQRFKEAEAIYRSILEEYPSNDETRVDMARMLASQQRYDAALGTLAPALRRPGHDHAVDCMAGRLMSRGLGRSREAQKLLDKCDK